MSLTKPSWLRYWSVKKNLSALNEHSSGTFYLINGLRFFGFVWILVAHTVFVYALYNGKSVFFQALDDAPFYLYWIWNADKAVDLFFVVSGFLISVILLKELNKSGDIRLKRFYFRRYLRLTPVYALIVIIFWASKANNYEWAWTNLLYVNNFLSPDKMALQWTWTLAVEEQFYLLLPLILLFIHKTPQRSFIKIMLGLLVASLLIRGGVLYYYDELWNANYRAMLSEKEVSLVFYGKLYDNLATRYGPFVLGVMAGYGYCFHQQTICTWVAASQHRALLLNIIAMSIIVFFMYFPILGEHYSESGGGLRLYVIFHRTVFCAAFTWFMLSVFLNFDHFRWIAKFYSLRIWHPLGQLTYSMYLIHFIVILLVMFQVNKMIKHYELPAAEALVIGVSSGAFISLLLSILLGVVCWLLIEKPFLNMRELFEVNRGATHAKPMDKSIGKIGNHDAKTGSNN